MRKRVDEGDRGYQDGLHGRSPRPTSREYLEMYKHGVEIAELQRPAPAKPQTADRPMFLTVRHP